PNSPREMNVGVVRPRAMRPDMASKSKVTQTRWRGMASFNKKMHRRVHGSVPVGRVRCKRLQKALATAPTRSYHRPPVNRNTACSIYEVARHASVSSSTVSRVLGGRAELVAPATRERVLAAAETLGYRPNRMARGLATGRSNIVGVLVHDIRNRQLAQ